MTTPLQAADRDAPGTFEAAPSGVQIRHERPAPETEHTVVAPLVIGLPDGRRLMVRRWSLSGVYDDAPSRRDLGGARLLIPFQGVEVGFPVAFGPVGEGGFRPFEGLTGRQREALGLFYRNLMVGRMAATEEVITALDTPVDLIPMGETEAEKAAGVARARPRFFRAALNIAWHLGLFVAVVWFVGSLAWSRIEGMTLSHARVTAERLVLTAPREGYLRQLATQDSVTQEGTVLARVEKPEGEEALADVDARHAALETMAAEARARLAAHDAVREEARAMVERLYSASALRRFDAGVPLRQGDHNDRRAALEATLRSVENDRDRAVADLRRLRQTEQYMNLSAPAVGLVVQWLTREGQYVRAGDPVAVFETDAPRMVRGWLDDRLAGSVRIGMRADILLRSSGVAREIEGRVAAVEAGADPSAPDVFGMIVTIEASGMTAGAAREALPFNAPAEIVVRRDLLGPLFGRSR